MQTSMIKPVQVEARKDYRIWVKFEDGVEGKVDLSNLIERGGLFKEWEDRGFFEKVRVADHDVIKWGNSDFHELCADSLYLTITGISADEYPERAKQNLIHA